MDLLCSKVYSVFFHDLLISLSKVRTNGPHPDSASPASFKGMCRSGLLYLQLGPVVQLVKTSPSHWRSMRTAEIPGSNPGGPTTNELWFLRMTCGVA